MSYEKNKMGQCFNSCLHGHLLGAIGPIYQKGGPTLPVSNGGFCSSIFSKHVPRRRPQNINQMNLIIEEIGTTPGSTASQLFIDGRAFCFVIEDGYRETKVPGETRIPSGRYEVVKKTYGGFYESYKKRFNHKFSLAVLDVPGFSEILIHIGNTPADTRGCLLVNRCIGINQSTGDYNGTDSTTTYRLLYSLIEKAFERGEDVWVDVLRRKNVTLVNYG